MPVHVANFERVARISTGDVQLLQGKTASQLAAGESVHRELRPDIGINYMASISTLLEEGAWLTQLLDSDEVRAIAVWRVFHTTYCGRRFEIDDLVTSDKFRSHGYGASLLQWLEHRAEDLGCRTLTLNSAMHRRDAHRFYAREGYNNIAFHFSKSLEAAFRDSSILTITARQTLRKN